MLRARINRNDLFLRLVLLLFYLFSFLFPFFHVPQRTILYRSLLYPLSLVLFFAVTQIIPHSVRSRWRAGCGDADADVDAGGGGLLSVYSI